MRDDLEGTDDRYDERYDDGYAEGPWASALTDPAPTSIASLALGTLSLAGLGLLNGSTYVLPLLQAQSPLVRTVASGLVGALLAVAAVGLGLLAQRRTRPGDPSWVPVIAQAGVLVAGIAVVLRLLATGAAVGQADQSFFFL